MVSDAELLDDLTDAQRDAVTHIDGPLLIIAAAGSGKTRVITRRVAYLISQGVPPAAILAITGQKQLLGREPVLRKSVELRNPYIDPLNYLQVEMLRRLRAGGLDAEAEQATRRVVELTINGISGGLKNTG